MPKQKSNKLITTVTDAACGIFLVALIKAEKPLQVLKKKVKAYLSDKET